MSAPKTTLQSALLTAPLAQGSWKNADSGDYPHLFNNPQHGFQHNPQDVQNRSLMLLREAFFSADGRGAAGPRRQRPDAAFQHIRQALILLLLYIVIIIIYKGRRFDP